MKLSFLLRFKVILLLLLNSFRLLGQSPDSLSTYWYQVASSLSEQQQLDSAIVCLKKASSYAQIAKKWEHLASCQLDQGFNFMYLQKLDSATFYYQQALTTAEQQLKDTCPVFINANHLQGVVYYYLGDYNKAIHHAQKALYYRKINHVDVVGIAKNLNNIATMFLEKSAYDKALEYYEQTLNIYNSLADAPIKSIALTHNNIGLCYNYKNKNNKALEHFLKAKNLFDQLPSAPIKQLIHLYNSWSIAYRDLGELDLAQQYLEQALVLHQQEPYKKEGSLANIGFLHLQKKEYTKAEKYLQEALNLEQDSLHPDLAKIQLYLGQCWANQGLYNQALAAYQKGITILVADFENTGKNNPNLQKYIRSPRNLLKLLHAKAQVLQSMQEYSLALTTYNLATDLILQMQRSYPNASTQFFLAQITLTLHEEAFQLAFEQYQSSHKEAYLQQALIFAEATKSKLLFDRVATNKQQKTGGVPDSILQKEKDLYLDIAFYKKKWFDAKRKAKTDKQQYFQQHIFDLDKQLEKLQTTLKENYPNYYINKQVQQDLSIQSIQKQLLQNKEDLLIEYFVSFDTLYVFVIEQTKATIQKLGTVNSLKTDLTLFWKSLLNPSSKEYTVQEAFKQFNTQAQNLYQKLLAPILPQNSHRLFIIQDEQLSFLPFAALLKKVSNSKVPNYLELDYLVYHYEFNYSYSAQLLLHNNNQQLNKELPVFLGLAPFSTKNAQDSFAVLPSSEKEIDYIYQTLGGTIFMNKDANINTFKTHTAASIIHIASHGIVNVQKPDYSFLAFANNEHLHAFEIQNIPLEANLVVLSACETGVGQFIKGEGSLSLARSFMYNNVPSVVMTLWNVKDQSSLLLMQHFYENLIARKRKSTALQEAQKAYLSQNADQQTAHPYFWAAHILLGNPKAIDNLTSSKKTMSTWWYWAIGAILLLILMVLKNKVTTQILKNTDN